MGNKREDEKQRTRNSSHLNKVANILSKKDVIVSMIWGTTEKQDPNHPLHPGLKASPKSGCKNRLVILEKYLYIQTCRLGST